MSNSDPTKSSFRDLFDTEVPISNWDGGVYPAIDDIISWLHLAQVHLTSSTPPQPRIPEFVMTFLVVASDLFSAKYRHGAKKFHEIYGTTDVRTALKDRWHNTLSILIQRGNIDSILRDFPSQMHSPATDLSFGAIDRSRLDPRLRTADEHSINTYAGSPSVSKTFNEADLRNPSVIPSAKAASPATSFRPRTGSGTGTRLPGETESVPMGSGVSCGKIGEGGMAAVYKIWNSTLEVFRAAKILRLDRICRTEEEIERATSRYELEAKVSAQLTHSNIVQIHAFCDFHDLPCLEMEYIEGMDLGKLVDTKGAFPVDLAIAISLLTARGLAYAHSQDCTIYNKQYTGIIHRDIKPNNILVDSKRGSIKISDFGLARPQEVSIHTAENTTVGTLAYASPEQLDAATLDTRTDIYSFGATMYEILAGKKLFPQTTFSALMAARHGNTFKPLTDLRGDIPKSLTVLVDRCLQQALNKRIQSAETLLDSLDEALDKLTKGERPEAVINRYVKNQFTMQGKGHAFGLKTGFFGGFLKR